jgi:hypothetical protein
MGLVLDTSLQYYLSGPMSGLPDYNFPVFAEAKKNIESIWNIKVISPHEILFEGEPGSLHWTAYMRGDLAALLKAGAIILLPGWPQSRGASKELDVALSLEYPVYFYTVLCGLPQLIDMNNHSYAF